MAVDLKTETPDGSLPGDGVLFGADSQSSDKPSVYSVDTIITSIVQRVLFEEAVGTFSGLIYVNRAAAIAATVPTPVQRIAVISGGRARGYLRGGTPVALTTAGGVTWSPDGTATAEHFETFALAVASTATRIVVETQHAIAANISIGIKTIEFTTGSLNIASGVVVSLNNQTRIIAPRFQIFFGDGTVSNLRHLHIEWFGIKNSSTSAADASPLATWQKAADALTTNGIFELAPGFTPWNGADGPVVFSKGQVVVGSEGMFTTTIRFVTSTNFDLFKWTTEFGGGAQRFRTDGAALTPASGTMFLFENADARRGFLKDLFISKCFNFATINGTAGTNLTNNISDIENVKVFDIYNRGILLNRTEGFYCRRIFMNALTGDAPNGMLVIQNKAQDVNFDHCSFSGGNVSLTISNATGVVTRDQDSRWNTFLRCNFDGAAAGIDISASTQLRFIDTWVGSNGRIVSGEPAGNGVWIRGTCKHIVFIGGSCCNNGQRGFRIDSGAEDIYISAMEVAGNNVNDGGFYNIDIFGGVSDFKIDDCRIGGAVDGWDEFPAPPARGVPAGGVQVRAGASDRYDIVNNRFHGLPFDITDNGTGTDKDVTTGNRSR